MFLHIYQLFLCHLRFLKNASPSFSQTYSNPTSSKALISSGFSAYVKDGVTEDFVRRRVLFALEDEKTYLRDGAYKLSYRVKKGKASHVSVEIYVRGGTVG